MKDATFCDAKKTLQKILRTLKYLKHTRHQNTCLLTLN